MASWPAGRQQRDAERRAVGMHRGRQREPAQLQQVDEIGVGAEPAVELDRIGQHLRDRVDGRHRRQQQRIDRGKHVVAHAPQSFEPVEGLERIDRARPRACQDDLAGDRMHGLGRRSDQRARRDVALRHPGPLVEQARRLVERLHVDLDDGGAEPGEMRDRRLVGGGRTAVAEEHALARRRHAQPDAVRHGAQASERTRTRIGIGRVGAGQHRERRKRVVGGEREHRYAIERAAGRHQPGGGDETEARLEPDDVAERRRHAAGPGRIGAERERHEAGRDRERRAAARAARDQARIEQVARDAVGRAHARPGRSRTDRDWSCRS